MEKTPQAAEAAKAGSAVIACVYQGYVPDDVAGQLPEGFAAQSWAAIIEDGKVVRVLAGTPESVVPTLLR